MRNVFASRSHRRPRVGARWGALPESRSARARRSQGLGHLDVGAVEQRAARGSRSTRPRGRGDERARRGTTAGRGAGSSAQVAGVVGAVERPLERDHDRRRRVEQPDPLGDARGPIPTRRPARTGRARASPRTSRARAGRAGGRCRGRTRCTGRARRAQRGAQRAGTSRAAIGSSHMYAQSTGWVVIASTTAKATTCRQKWTSAPPTLASGSTARGKRTLPTSGAFDVIDTVEVIRLDADQGPHEQAAQHPDGEAGEAGAEDREHHGVHDEQEQRLQHRPGEAEHRVLVADRRAPCARASPSSSRKRRISPSWASAVRRPDIGRSGLDVGADGVAPSAAEVATVSAMTGIKRYRRPSSGAAMAWSACGCAGAVQTGAARHRNRLRRQNRPKGLGRRGHPDTGPFYGRHASVTNRFPTSRCA